MPRFGLLLLVMMVFMWMSAKTQPNVDGNDHLQVDIKPRKVACSNLGGLCIKKRKSCPVDMQLETLRGKPYCSRRRRCCYPAAGCKDANSTNSTSSKIVRAWPPQCQQSADTGEPCVLYDGIEPVCERHWRDGKPSLEKWCYTRDCRNSRTDCGTQTCTIYGNRCVEIHEKPAECFKENSDYEWCWVDAITFGFCTGGCPANNFLTKHVCEWCQTKEDANDFSNINRPNPDLEKDTNTVFSNIRNNINYNFWIERNECQITPKVKTWVCIPRGGGQGIFWECTYKGCCTGKSTGNGHFKTLDEPCIVQDENLDCT